ncbi:MAG: YciI family protein, partial [Actinomycetota bacterium]
MPGIEPCFVVEATYAKDAAERRKPHRQAHLDRLAMLNDEGALLMAGAFDDLSASFLAFAVGSEEA